MSKKFTVDIGVREVSPAYHSDELDEIPLCLRVGNVRDPTDESPAVVEVSVRNCIDRVVTVMFGMCVPFSDFYPTEYDGTSPVLVPVNGDVENGPDEDLPQYLDWDQFRPQSPENGVWKLTEAFTRLNIGNQLQLDPGEQLQNRYELLAGPDASAHPTGEYRFSGEYKLEQGDYVQLGEHDLTLRVELTILLSPRCD